MKTLVVCLSALLSVGCIGQSYNSTRVGPDRFVVVSQGHDAGPENYSRMLQEAYKTCFTAGFKDYTVSNVAHEPRRVVAFVRCENETKFVQPQVVANKEEPKAESNSESSFMSDLQEFYNNTKKKLEDRMKE